MQAVGEAARPGRRRLPSGIGWLLVAGIAVVAMVLGVVGVYAYDHIKSGDSAGTDSAAAEVEQGLRAQLTIRSYSGGGIVGDLHTEGDLVGLVEGAGGVLLSLTDGPSEPGGHGRTADVMLGLLPDRGVSASVDNYPIRCYRFTFGIAAYTVQRSGISCPTHRTDGQPGSVTAQIAKLLGITITLRTSTPSSPASYPLTLEGAQQLLAERYGLTDATGLHPVPVNGALGQGIYAAAFEYQGACFYLRMAAPTVADAGQPVWLAPVADQAPTPCDGAHALAGAALYGVNGAAEG